MKKRRTHSHKNTERVPQKELAMEQTSSVCGHQVQREVVQVLEGFGKMTDRNAKHWKKELEAMRRSKRIRKFIGRGKR